MEISNALAAVACTRICTQSNKKISKNPLSLTARVSSLVCNIHLPLCRLDDHLDLLCATRYFIDVNSHQGKAPRVIARFRHIRPSCTWVLCKFGAKRRFKTNTNLKSESNVFFTLFKRFCSFAPVYR